MHDLAMIGRVLLAAGLGFAIGSERELRGHPAGARTFTLLSAGAALFTVIAVDAFPATAEKLIAGIVTGVGFLGAGIVLRDPAGHVRGLTTAAATWAVAAVGVSAGAARFVLAIAGAVLYLLILEYHVIPGLRLLDARRWSGHVASEEGPSMPSPPDDL